MNEEQLSGDSEAEQLKRTGAYGHKQTAATKKKISDKSKGEDNSQWKDGRHHTYQRRIKGLKKGDGKVVHHKDENRHNNKKTNLVVKTTAAHNRHHHKKK